MRAIGCGAGRCFSTMSQIDAHVWGSGEEEEGSGTAGEAACETDLSAHRRWSRIIRQAVALRATGAHLVASGMALGGRGWHGGGSRTAFWVKWPIMKGPGEKGTQHDGRLTDMAVLPRRS